MAVLARVIGVSGSSSSEMSARQAPWYCRWEHPTNAAHEGGR
jgi:hypothetical protein